MPAPRPFSCYVIGETTLTLQCCEKLLHRGHVIHCIFSPNPAIAAWAVEKAIPHAPLPEPLNGFIKSARPCDYLFSIVNNIVLPAQLLALPRRLAINFHDAPLPRYGGIHATSWAIMNREQTHGITWHVMTPKIDAGGLLKQKKVSVRPADTALSLNLRCYQAAAEAFAELIDELADDAAEAVPQDLSQRSYFPRHKRPAAGCLISWSRQAEEIDAFVRALDFGPYPNDLGVPKIGLDEAFLLVPKLQVLDSSSAAAPGTIVAADDSGIIVSTATHDMRITEAGDMDGRALSPARLAGDFGLKPGFRIMEPGEALRQRLTLLYEQTCCHEPFWHGRLSGLQPLALPDMRLSGAGPQGRSTAAFSLQAPAAMTKGSAHPWQMLSAAFAAFLARHTGARDIHIGLRHAALDEMIAGLEGFYASCVPLCLTADRKKTFQDFCGEAVAQIEAALLHLTYPRDLILRQPDLRFFAGKRLPVRVRHVRSLARVCFDDEAALELIASDDGACLLRVDTAVVDEGYAESIRAQLSAFMQAAAEGPQLTLEELPLASAAYKKTIIESWNDTGAPFDADMCMHELFERQAALQPAAVATLHEGSAMTFGELNARANALAWHLKQEGVCPGSLVGICLDRSHDMIAALLAILKAGGAYVPLEPSYPLERIQAIIKSAGIRLIVSQDRHGRLVTHRGVKTVCVDSAEIAAERRDNPPRASGPGDLAYVIYTSGSTGAPKGVMVAHRPFINLCEWLYRTCGFGPDDCALFITSLGFDLSVFDIFGLLGCGGRIHIVSDGARKDAGHLARMLCSEPITFWDSAPAALQLVAPALRAQPGPVKNTKLRQVFLSGDWIPVALPDEVRKAFPGAQVMSLGGATEATVWSNYFPVNRVEGRWRSIPYGRPIQNCRYYILDDLLQVCPPGVTGNLYIAGECLSMGYLNEPELTGRSFVADPFQAPGKLMYRTGDLARFFPDGVMEFLGRSDFQVKVRGYRIELGEIEHVLRRHDAVTEAVAAVQQGAAGDQKIVAYLIARSGALPPAKDLRAHAATYLPDYMVPNMFVRLDALPVTANGKLDRKQLPWPVLDAAPREPVPEQQRGRELEELTAMLVACFRKVLGLAAMAPDADFFDLGVTSLNLIQVAEMLHEKQGIDVTVEAFLDHPSIASFASFILGQQPAPCRSEAPPGPALPAEPPAAPAGDMLRRMQISLPAEAFLDAAVLADISSRVQRFFPGASISAGSGASLPSPGQAVSSGAPAESSPQVLPEAALCADLAAYMKAVLQSKDIGPDEDFFDLGVTSLNLIEIAERLHAQHGIDVPVEVFLDHSTIRSLAAYIAAKSLPASRAAAQTRPNAQAQAAPPAQGALALDAVRFAGQAYRSCASSSGFTGAAVPLRSLSHFLGLLRQETVQAAPKYLYPSAGGLNAVQAYVYIRQGRVEGIPEGIYYYHPVRHQLICLTAPVSIDEAAFHPAERRMFAAAGFCIFFIAQLAALQPVYSGLSPALATLDAGYLMQLLMSRKAGFGLGLRALEGVDFERVRPLFKLDDTHLFLSCMAAGPAGEEGPGLCPPAERPSASAVDHFAGAAPDWTCLEAASAGRLDALNALTPEEHERLHLQQLQLRALPRQHTAVSLQPITFMHNQYLLRSTQRSFVRRPVPFDAFSKFMALLKRLPQGGGAAALYLSAGNAYGVEIYVQVKPGAVEQVPEGIYFYHPVDHVLHRKSGPGSCDFRQAHFPRNRTYFAEAAFSVFCIAQMDVLQPIFGGQALQRAMLEAGCMGQVLMDHQAEFGLGVCPIGAMRFDLIRAAFGLGPRHRLAHSFLCGPVDRCISMAGHEHVPVEK